jgi:outer membrane protein OmpA-like peptidoglycan-associated protein
MKNLIRHSIVLSRSRVCAIASLVVLVSCGGVGPTAPAPAAVAVAPNNGASGGTSAGTSAGTSGTPQAAPPTPASPTTSAAPPAAPPVLPYEQAVFSAATTLLKNAKLPPDGGVPQARYVVVIDPLIDGMTGSQSRATRAMGAQLATLMREHYPQYDVQPFSAANVARNPLVLIGTFTGVNAQRQTSGAREAYRICFALADLKSGKLVSKGLAFAQAAGVDNTPLAYYQDSPAWTEDPATIGYIRTCQGTRAGDPINPLYVDRILAASLVAEAIEAYEAGRYQDSLALYTNAQRTSAGDQFRVYNGVYLANWKLGRREQAQAAFQKVVDFGLAQKRLAVKFLFRPGSTAFSKNSQDIKLTSAYPVWIKAISTRAAASGSCLEVSGHTSATGPEALNERLSQLRAEYVKSQLEASTPVLSKRLIANGMGSKQTLVGTGRDDASDAIDRRVEFKVIGCV